eukprot:scaffold1314_cov386-Pavlova_lutheri.AAC.37
MRTTRKAPQPRKDRGFHPDEILVRSHVGRSSRTDLFELVTCSLAQGSRAPLVTLRLPSTPLHVRSRGGGFPGKDRGRDTWGHVRTPPVPTLESSEVGASTWAFHVGVATAVPDTPLSLSVASLVKGVDAGRETGDRSWVPTHVIPNGRMDQAT